MFKASCLSHPVHIFLPARRDFVGINFVFMISSFHLELDNMESKTTLLGQIGHIFVLNLVNINYSVCCDDF